MPNPLNDIRRTALNLLARRDHSEKELANKLRLRKFQESEIQLILKRLGEENLLKPEHFLENYIYHRRKKGFGPRRIRAELLERGIIEELIEHHLKITDNAWLIEAKKVWQKRFKNELPQDHKTRAQQVRFLHYRGFTQEQINSIFNSDT